MSTKKTQFLLMSARILENTAPEMPKPAMNIVMITTSPSHFTRSRTGEFTKILIKTTAARNNKTRPNPAVDRNS